MSVLTSKASLLRSGLAAMVLLLAAGASQAQSVNLTAGATTATLPDGAAVPMWGYSCDATQPAATTATCSALNGAGGWSPVKITVPYIGTGTTLTINLTNTLVFQVPIPTSIVIVGQLGGGLGNAPTTTPSPEHAAQGVTWPSSGPAVVPAGGCDNSVAAGNSTNCPPAQPPRVQSFATEVAAGGASVALTWSNLQPGTYLIESGTHPSIQGAMGLYGVLVVTTPGTGSAGTAYAGVAYDADATMVFGEIDPLQNQAVADAVVTPGFKETNVWSGQPGQCGDPAATAYKTCYPPTVNYDPRYYLINGTAFDRTNPTLSTQAILGTSGSPGAVGNGTVLLRLVNAGLRMHVPSVVGRNMTLYAEDGNPLPGVPRVQSEVFMAAGKTYDVGIKPTQNGASYAPQTYAVYDRQLSLSTNNQRDGGMIAYVNVGGATTGAGTAAAAAGVTANSDSYYLVSGNTLSVADPLKGLIANDVGVYGVSVLTAPTGGALTLRADGTFIYVPKSGTQSDSFTYCANPAAGGKCAATATVVLAECKDACKGAAPLANADSYASTVSTYLKIGSPGVLENDSDPSGLPLKVDLTTISVPANSDLTVTVQADGSFVAAVPAGGQRTFTYSAKNSQGTLSVPATVTLNFPAATNLAVRVVDAKVYAANPTDHSKDITDYRWVIEEDRTFHVDPACQINDPTNTVRPATCPPLPVQSLGYNFHTATMGVVAAGCTGPVSCEAGQTTDGGNTPVACDVGDGQCRNAPQKDPVLPSQVHLDPSKRYYLSILPADGVNPVLSGAGGSPDGVRKFDIAKDCGPYDPASSSWVPGGPAGGYPDGVFGCGHMMGGAQISTAQVSLGANAAITIPLQETPAPTAKVTAFVFEDDWPLNGENDAGGGVDILAPQEPGLGGFEIKLFDQAGGLGDNTGQITYDMFNQPVSNALAGTLDPNTHQNACPITARTDGLVGMVPTCPTYEEDGKTLSPLAGQVVIDNLYPGLYEIQAFPAADRIGRGEEWLQTNTLDGGKPHEAFLKNDEPAYFQEFGPGGFHVAIGFANPKIINDRRHNSAGTGICDPLPKGGGLTCTSTLKGTVTNAHMSRTPDQRLVSTSNYDNYSFTQCYVGIGPQDADDFALVKCNADGTFEFDNLPTGDFKIVVFDQWNDIMLDGLVSPVKVAAGVNNVDFPVTQWRTNLYTRTFLDQNGDGVSQPEEPGLPLVATNIRYRDGSFGFFNNTDLDGYAGFNEVFPFMNWLVVEADTTRYKVTGVHSVNDTGGVVDGAGGGSSDIAAFTANTLESNSLPISLRVPGAVYCTDADCSTQSIKNGPYYSNNRADSGPTSGLSSGRIDPPGTTTEAWQGLLGLNDFLEFAVKPFVPGENGGIRGHVIYASTRPFDDPQLLLQLSWEPGVAHVKVNLYQEGTAPDGTTTLKLIDTTTSSSWDDFAQGFRSDGVPNMNCPGQAPDSPFFATLQGSTQWLDPNRTALPNSAQFKCYDGWSMLNQVQPAPYDGMYRFPSVTAVDPVSGRPVATNCTACTTNPDDHNPMLPAGKYVVEVIVPPGYELVKEEDKNILLGDTYIAPVTQQFPAGFGNVFIMPDQAAVNAYYNKNNPLNATTDLGATPRHEGDTGSVEAFWPCVGAERIVPDYNSLFPTAGQNAPFAGASRHLCDRKEVTLTDQATALAKFYIFTPTHVTGHFTGTITNDFASEFDPFSPQFGEKFGPPNLPVALRDYTGNEMGRVYSDQWGIYNGLNYSSYAVNPPNPTGYIPQMMIACMNDPGPIPATNALGQMIDPNGNVVTDRAAAKMITDPNYNPAYSNFCYEQPFMPGFTTYMDTPVIPTQAFADGYNLPDSEYPDGTPGVMSVVNSADSTRGPWVAAPGATVTIASIGRKVVQNPAFSGPSATSTPYNQKTITRNYGFGAQGPRSKVTIGGLNAPISSWSDGSITVQVPAGLPNCGVGQITGRSGSGSPTQRTNSQCGELVITGDNGKQSIDAITVTVGGTTPKYVAGEDSTGHAIQNAIDAARPGDLIVLGPGTYKEQVLMWKPVRLQGVGSGAVIINADAHPAGKMDAWRRQVNCLFGLTIDGVPNPNNANFDRTGSFSCPGGMFLRDGRIDFEGFVGWDATGNGNLAQVLQEPTLMGAYEGAGITVLARGVREPNNTQDYWGQPAQGGAGAGAFPDGSRYLSSSNQDCTVPSNGVTMRDFGTGNFYCNPSRIDGVSIINSSQGGGAIFLHGWNHNLEIANTRIYANHGTLTGGINLGNGEVPPTYINDGTICGPGVAAPAPLCPPLQGTPTNGIIPFALNVNVHVHHNDIYNNASLGDALFSGTPSGAGAITVSAGADNYVIEHNWIAGNLSSSDGGGIVHSGFTINGRISNNWVLFNQTVNPTLPTNGGGIGIIGSNSDRTLASTGLECGSTNDVDCIPGIGDGTGRGLVIDSNLIIGNSAESGSGGGLRVQQVNGSEVGAFPTRPDRWNDVTVINNIIANNVAGWDGAGISLEDALKATVVNNTITSNDTTASAGVLFKALNAPMAASPPPGCTQPDPGVPLPPGCTDGNAPHNPQPAGLVTMVNTPNLIASFPAQIICPSGFNYGNAADSQSSRTNGRCRQISLPLLANDLFWQNRAFHVGYADQAGNEVADPVKGGTVSGSNQSQQNLVALFPALNQTATGQCVNQASFPNYWDVGVRGDTSPTNHTIVGFTSVTPGVTTTNPLLTVNNSILTANPAGYVNGTNDRVPASSPLVGQYCNGSRVPPENGGHGYQAPAGRSETTGLSPVFVFNNIQVAATVDEGNNWINLGYGPLTLFNTAGQDMVNSLDGITLGAYSSRSVAEVLNGGLNSVAPNHDFFGTPRARSSGNPADIGAVELPPPPFAATVSPSPLAFGNQVVNTTSGTLNLTVTNTGTNALAGGTVTGIAAPFARVTTGSFPGNAPNCAATLAVGASCTIKVQFAPTAAQAYDVSVTVVYTNATVTPTPVHLTGTGTTPVLTAAWAPTSHDFGNATRGVGTFSAPTQIFVLTNTGNAPLTLAQQGQLAGTNPTEFSIIRLLSTCGPAGGGQLAGQTTLQPGQSCMVTVQFRPQTAQTTGAKSATLSIVNSAGTQTAALTGNAQ